jgi:glycosyltransferase involved in cell wall biosynthesis
MIEENPLRVEKAKIVVGIPSFNEADSISYVVEKVDEGLEKYFKNFQKVIINSDNNSPDRTRQVFLKTKTNTPKIYISTPERVRGKGQNILNLFLKIKELEADWGMTVDADLKSITSEWVKCLLQPIEEGYDFITPLYYRHKFDASITNHLCYPLIYGLLGYNIRQPIGGDFGFSKKMVDFWLEQKWSESAKNFGIDVFMTLGAIKSGFSIGQVNLGSKIHKPSKPKLDKMFLEVTETLFSFLIENRELWQRKIELKIPPLVCETKNEIDFQNLQIDYKEIEEKAISQCQIYYKFAKPYFSQKLQTFLEKMFFEEKSLKIEISFWARIVYEVLYIYQTMDSEKKNEILKLLRALYFGRMASFIKENSISSHEESERRILEQAKEFFKKRKEFLKLFDIEDKLS